VEKLALSELALGPVAPISVSWCWLMWQLTCHISQQQ